MSSDSIVDQIAAPKPRPRQERSVRIRRASTRSTDRHAPPRVSLATNSGELSLNRSEPDTQSEPGTWRLGVITDRAGHLHLGAVVARPGTEPPMYVDLLAAVGAASAAELDLNRLVVLVRGEHVAELRRLVEQCIDDVRLKHRLVELANRSMNSILSTQWPA